MGILGFAKRRENLHFFFPKPRIPMKNEGGRKPIVFVYVLREGNRVCKFTFVSGLMLECLCVVSPFRRSWDIDLPVIRVELGVTHRHTHITTQYAHQLGPIKYSSHLRQNTFNRVWNFELAGRVEHKKVKKGIFGVESQWTDWTFVRLFCLICS